MSNRDQLGWKTLYNVRPWKFWSVKYFSFLLLPDQNRERKSGFELSGKNLDRTAPIQTILKFPVHLLEVQFCCIPSSGSRSMDWKRQPKSFKVFWRWHLSFRSYFVWAFENIFNSNKGNFTLCSVKDIYGSLNTIKNLRILLSVFKIGTCLGIAVSCAKRFTADLFNERYVASIFILIFVLHYIWPTPGLLTTEFCVYYYFFRS